MRQGRTRKQKRAARLLGQGMTQDQAAAAVDVSTRTLRNWKAAPAFRRELERQRDYGARKPASEPSSAGKPRARRDAGRRRARAAAPRPTAGPQPDRPSTSPARQQTVAEQTLGEGRLRGMRGRLIVGSQHSEQPPHRRKRLPPWLLNRLQR